MVTKPLGLIGIGLLGTALAGRLLGAGFRVVGTDVDPRRRDALRSMGGDVAEDAGDVVRSCDRILLSLPTSEIVAEVLDGVAGSLGPGQMVIDTTTGDPTQMAAMGDRLEARGVAYLDATVSGSSEQARRGDVVLMVGGDERAFASCGDLFGALARAAYHVGPTGSGAKMKLATNLVLGLNRMALAEGLALARGLGMDLGLTLSVLMDSAAYSRVMDAKGAKMIARDFTPQARLSQHLKDVHLILDEARRVGVASPLSEVHRTMLEAAVGAGYGDADNSAIFLAYDVPRTPDGRCRSD